MGDQDHDEAIELFQTITGADNATAKHVLEAHAWNMDRGIGYFMEYGSTIPGQPAVDIDADQDCTLSPWLFVHLSNLYLK